MRTKMLAAGEICFVHSKWIFLSEWVHTGTDSSTDGMFPLLLEYFYYIVTSAHIVFASPATTVTLLPVRTLYLQQFPSFAY